MTISNALISIVVPVFNEELNIYPFYEALIPIIEQCKNKYQFEIIFTDNHSTDTTYELLKKLTQYDSRVKVFRFTKNYGYQKSILMGYLNTKGDAVIQLDCDLQDPPEMIISFLKHWEDGNLVVYGIRKKTQDNFFMYLTRKFFYRLISFLSEDELPLDAGDFRLVDRKVIEVLRTMDDAQPYLRGAIASFGFQQYGIPYDRAARKRGESNFKLKDMIKLAIDGILNHSVIPLRLASFIGISISIMTCLIAVLYLLGKVLFHFPWPAGFTTLAMLNLLGISLNALFLGVLGEYIGRIYQQTKKRPILIESTLATTALDTLEKKNLNHHVNSQILEHI